MESHLRTHAVAPERINEFESGGHRSGAKVGAPIGRANFFWSCLSTFFGSKSTISRFGERFRDGQYTVVIFLLAVLLITVPPCPAICKSGGTCNRSRHHCTHAHARTHREREREVYFCDKRVTITRNVTITLCGALITRPISL